MIRRYWRALLGAVRLTLSGKTILPSPQATLRAWASQTSAHVDATLSICAKMGLDEAARKDTRLTIEGRRVNLNTVLLGVKFHAEQEYPRLLQTPDGRSQAAIVGTNINDCFLLERFITSLPSGEAQSAIKRLREHLENIPQIVTA